jgi:4'-phosphopantetheinyl transferase
MDIGEARWVQRLGARLGAEVWRLVLDVEPATRTASWGLLSPAERARADRVRAGPRERWVMARAGLRVVLAAQLGTRPEDVDIASGPDGKPYVAGGPRFNLSHSAGLALCAVIEGHEVGIDVEAVRPVAEADAIAERWIGPEAVAALRSAGPDRDAEFLRWWTRREALLKGLGVGLAGAERAVAPEIAARWSIVDLAPGPGFVGALAVERPPRGPGRV